MARKVASRLRVSGVLVAKTPLHVGGYGESVACDLPLARDGAGRPYVPGTALAGPLRAWCEEAFADQGAVRALWGWQPERRGDEEGQASYVLLDDGAVVVAGGVDEIRDGVGLDREHGCAARGIKFTRAVLPVGSTVALELAVDLAPGTERAAQAMVGHLLKALQAGEIRLGAAKTRGLGRVELRREVDVRLERLDCRDGLLKLLRGLAEPLTVDHLVGRDPSLRPAGAPRIDLQVEWRPLGPVMVKAGIDGLAVDMLPLTTAIGDRAALVLPGSSVKGALRSHAERIVRTVRGDRAGRPGDAPNRNFLDQIDVELVRELFGAPGERSDGRREAPEGEHLGLGALGVDDCHAVTPMTSDDWWSSVVAASTKDRDGLQAKLREAGLGGFNHTFHVSIDRWTGGAAESALFSVLEPGGEASWEPLRLTVDFRRLPEELREAGLALTFLLVAELSAGRIPLGFATHRGMGSVEVRAVRCTARGDPEAFPLLEVASFEVKEPGTGLLGGLPEPLARALREGWQTFVRS